jgi:hypothetical protein
MTQLRAKKNIWTMEIRNIWAMLSCPINSNAVIITARAASIPTTKCTAVKLLVALKPLKQLCQNIMYRVLSWRHMIRMNSMLLIMVQSNILNLKEVAVKAGIRDELPRRK